jgi:soluble lytic murein transglycosylase
MFSRYVDEGGLAAPYAQVEMARLLAAMGRLVEASQQAEEALLVLPESRRPAVLLMMAQESELVDDAEARTWYERLLSESESSADKALALWRLSAIEQAAGNPSWAEQARQVAAEYPATAAASAALDSLLEEDIEVDSYVEGLVRYRHFENEEALEALRRFLEEGAGGSEAAAARYYVGAIQERLGEDDAAIGEYAAAYRLAPDGPLAANALWWRGRLLEKQGRLEEAMELYELMTSEQAGSEFAADAAFRLGLVLYRQGRLPQAAGVWRSAAATAQNEEDRARAMLWVAKAELGAGEENLALSHLEELRREQPLGYYGLRADVLLRESSDAEETMAATPAATPEEEGVAAWLASATGETGNDGWMLWLDKRWVRGLGLTALGMPYQARAELRALMYGSESAVRLWTLSRMARCFGLTEISARSAQLVLERIPEEKAGSVPEELLRLAYPLDYEELLERAESEEGVPPLVMLALIRQESFFDPLAGSMAGASGLTQVIPPTGQEIARDLGLDFEAEKLLEPETSILFGAHYLSAQLSTFDGNLYHALAAYNAGPGNARRWQSAAAGDMDLFLEEIDFAQAELYVRRVMENLSVYRYLYDGEEYPRLPY